MKYMIASDIRDEEKEHCKNLLNELFAMYKSHAPTDNPELNLDDSGIFFSLLCSVSINVPLLNNIKPSEAMQMKIHSAHAVLLDLLHNPNVIMDDSNKYKLIEGLKLQLIEILIDLDKIQKELKIETTEDPNFNVH